MADMACAHCGAAVMIPAGSVHFDARCSGCGSAIETILFPAFYERSRRGRGGEAVSNMAEASCFYHPTKKADVPCDECGRFLCALCDVQLEARHLCPPCVEALHSTGRLGSLETHRTLYDSVALSLSILPILVFYFTIITAPISLYVALRYWKTPGSILPRTKIRFIVAIILSVLQMVAWSAAIYACLT